MPLIPVITQQNHHIQRRQLDKNKIKPTMPCEPLCPNIERNLIMHLLLVREKSAIVRQMCAVLEEDSFRCARSSTIPFDEEYENGRQALVVHDAKIAKLFHKIATGCEACRSIQ